MAWRPTKKSDRVMARRLVGDAWEDVEVKDLHPRDVVRFVAPEGCLIHPITQEEDDDCVSLVEGDPIRNDDNRNGSLAGAVGWGVPVCIFDNMAELKKGGLS